VLGLPAYPDLLTAALNNPIDIVNIFRRPEFVPDLVEQAIAISRESRVECKLGVIITRRARRAYGRRSSVVMDRCMKVNTNAGGTARRKEPWTR